MNQVALMDGLLSLTVGSYLTMLCDVGIKRGKVQIKSVKYVTSMSQNVILQYLRK
jgi:hypothetical protein